MTFEFLRQYHSTHVMSDGHWSPVLLGSISSLNLVSRTYTDAQGTVLIDLTRRLEFTIHQAIPERLVEYLGAEAPRNQLKAGHGWSNDLQRPQTRSNLGGVSDSSTISVSCSSSGTDIDPAYTEVEKASMTQHGRLRVTSSREDSKLLTIIRAF